MPPTGTSFGFLEGMGEAAYIVLIVASNREKRDFRSTTPCPRWSPGPGSSAVSGTVAATGSNLLLN